MSGELPGYGRQRRILSQGIDGTHALIIHLRFTAKSPASGIYKCSAKSVGLLQANDLAVGGRVEQHGVEAIGRAIWCDVAQVGSGEAILIRNLVITPDCEEVLGDEPLSGEGIGCGIPICVSFDR